MYKSNKDKVKKYDIERINKSFGKTDAKINKYTKLIESASVQNTYSNSLPNGISRQSIYLMPDFETDHDIILNTIDSFDPEFWNDMLVYMNNFFDNREAYNIELPNCPCSELRELRNSICHNQGNMNYRPCFINDPSLTILKYQQTEEIKLT